MRSVLTLEFLPLLYRLVVLTMNRVRVHIRSYPHGGMSQPGRHNRKRNAVSQHVRPVAMPQEM